MNDELTREQVEQELALPFERETPAMQEMVMRLLAHDATLRTRCEAVEAALAVQQARVVSLGITSDAQRVRAEKAEQQLATLQQTHRRVEESLGYEGGRDVMDDARIKAFNHDRDAALRDVSKLEAFCKKWKIHLPSNPESIRRAVLKARTAIPGLPAELRLEAKK